MMEPETMKHENAEHETTERPATTAGKKPMHPLVRKLFLLGGAALGASILLQMLLGWIFSSSSYDPITPNWWTIVVTPVVYPLINIITTMGALFLGAAVILFVGRDHFPWLDKKS